MIQGNRESKFLQSYNNEFICLVRLDSIFIKIYATVCFAEKIRDAQEDKEMLNLNVNTEKHK